MRDLIQERCAAAGVQIVRMEFMEVSYHVEIAQSLLQIQQAQSKIDARKLIVTGAVSIVHDALADLERRHIVLDDKDKGDLVKKLMVITCSDHGHAHPVLNI